MSRSLKIFIVDKDNITVSIVENYLREVNYDFSLEKCGTLSEAKEKIDENALNLFIVDASENVEQIGTEIDNLEDTFKNCKFIITAYDFKTDNIVRFLRKSKKDFITKPIIKTRFLEIVNEIVEKMTSEQDFSGQGKVISVFSNKGGLGKTTVAVNLGYELARRDRRSKVAIVDMNLFLGDVTTFLDITPPYDLSFLIEKLDVTKDVVDLTTQYSDSNYYVIADSPYRDYSRNITKEDVVKMLNILRKKFKYIIIDNSSAITGKTKYILDLSDMILLITEANLPTLNNCKRCLDFFEHIGLQKKTQIVLNRYSSFDECKKQDVADILQKDIFAVIPNDWQTSSSAINKGITIGETNPFSDIYYSFGELADLVARKLCR